MDPYSRIARYGYTTSNNIISQFDGFIISSLIVTLDYDIEKSRKTNDLSGSKINVPETGYGCNRVRL